MKQIRHDRPLFRYLDNFARENRRSPTVADPAEVHLEVDRARPQRLMKEPDAEALTRHLNAMDQLTAEAREAIRAVFDQAETRMQTQLELIESIGAGKGYGKKKARDEAALESLRAACSRFNDVCRRELKDGRSPPRVWFARFRVLMGSAWTSFEELDDLIHETNLSGGSGKRG